MAYNEQLARRMRFHLEAVPGTVEKKMFGGIGFLINGNMACGVNRDSLIVRLSDQDYEAAIQRPSVKTFDLTGRPMKGWITVAPAGYETEDDLENWIQQGVAFARSLPGK